jgi:hypothetical protein
LRFDIGRIERVGEDGALLRMDVTFTSHATGRSVALPVVELLTLRGEQIARSEIFVQDTAALLSTLPAR